VGGECQAQKKVMTHLQHLIWRPCSDSPGVQWVITINQAAAG